MTRRKRAFDLFFVSLLIFILAPVMCVLIVWLYLVQGRPVFHVTERMKSPDRAFLLWKFRTMKTVEHDSGVSGGDKQNRVTRPGQKLRDKRLDELPQLWNILVGDLSFVGPRPPLREYVEKFPDLYAEVLKSRPGVTGLATITYHETEGRLLEQCKTREETDEVYARICVPRKARLDRIYQAHQSVCFDFALVFRTIGNLFHRRQQK